MLLLCVMGGRDYDVCPHISHSSVRAVGSLLSGSNRIIRYNV